MMEEYVRTPILIGESGAEVALVRHPDGRTWIEKSSSSKDLENEMRVLEWCSGRLPVPRVLESTPSLLVMSVLPGTILPAVPVHVAVPVLARALHFIHSVPVAECPFDASWETRLNQGEENIRAGLVDESDFDEDNAGRSAVDILAELRSLPPLPDVRVFTHGDACLPNFLCDGHELTGIVDLGRAGVAHPAQDWALALRSVGDNFGPLGERLFREHLPGHSANERILRRFRLLDELF